MRFRIGILLLCVLATAARGQEARPQHAQGKDVSFLANAVSVFQFDTKLDGCSEFSVTRFLFPFDLSKRIDGTRNLGISLFYDYEDYDFRGATSFAGPSPSDTVHRIGFGIPFVQRLESDWRLVFTPSAEISRESGAGWGNALAYGAVLSAGKRVGDTLTGGSALTLIDKAERFDAIVFGEIVLGRWMAGSDFFRRTHKDQAAWPAEIGGANTLVQLAISYRRNRVTLFRNGREYAAYSFDQGHSFGDDATVLLGLRYIGDMGEFGFFAGAIEDARIYDRALGGEQIAALRPNEPSDLRPLAWWSFEDGKAEDVMETFPATRLEGCARIHDGKLVLDGSSYLHPYGSLNEL